MVRNFFHTTTQFLLLSCKCSRNTDFLPSKFTVGDLLKVREEKVYLDGRKPPTQYCSLFWFLRQYFVMKNCNMMFICFLHRLKKIRFTKGNVMSSSICHSKKNSIHEQLKCYSMSRIMQSPKMSYCMTLVLRRQPSHDLSWPSLMEYARAQCHEISNILTY